MGTQLYLPKKGAEPPSPIFGPCPLWPNGWMDQDGTWHGGGPCPGHIVLHGDPVPLPQKRGSSKFSAYVYCGHTAGWIKTALGMEVGLGPGHIVLDGDLAPVPKKWQSCQFSARLYCGQTAGCIKTPLSMEVGLSPATLC